MNAIVMEGHPRVLPMSVALHSHMIIQLSKDGTYKIVKSRTEKKGPRDMTIYLE